MSFNDRKSLKGDRLKNKLCKILKNRFFLLNNKILDNRIIPS